MSDISTAPTGNWQRAREILAASYEECGFPRIAKAILRGESTYSSEIVCMAICNALTTRLAPDRTGTDAEIERILSLTDEQVLAECSPEELRQARLMRQTIGSALDRFLELERDQLREALATYCDRSRMGTVARADLQQVIDDAFAWAADKGIRPRGAIAADIVREMTPAPDREAMARIIDPAKWALVDHFRSKPDRPDLEARIPDTVAPSLTKADAILSLMGEV